MTGEEMTGKIASPNVMILKPIYKVHFISRGRRKKSGRKTEGGTGRRREEQRQPIRERACSS